MNELVSIIIPTYNRASTIEHAIKSVLNQTYKNLELIIVDDASTDNTQEIINSIKDDRIVYVRHDKNRGGGTARNTGIRLAKGEFIAFLDSDDEWQPSKLKKQLELLHCLNDDYGVIYTGFAMYDEKRRANIFFKPETKGQIYSHLLEKNCVGTISTILVKTSLVREVGGFDERLSSCQDWDLYLKLSRITQFDFVAEPLVLYSSSHKLKRISNERDMVENGYNVIEEKYKIFTLPKQKLSSYLYNKGLFYLYFLDCKLEAIKFFTKSFLICRKIRYFKGFLLVARKAIFLY